MTRVTRTPDPAQVPPNVATREEAATEWARDLHDLQDAISKIQDPQQARAFRLLCKLLQLPQ
jgi:hypothetical protein